MEILRRYYRAVMLLYAVFTSGKEHIPCCFKPFISNFCQHLLRIIPLDKVGSNSGRCDCAYDKSNGEFPAHIFVSHTNAKTMTILFGHN